MRLKITTNIWRFEIIYPSAKVIARIHMDFDTLQAVGTGLLRILLLGGLPLFGGGLIVLFGVMYVYLWRFMRYTVTSVRHDPQGHWRTSYEHMCVYLKQRKEMLEEALERIDNKDIDRYLIIRQAILETTKQEKTLEFAQERGFDRYSRNLWSKTMEMSLMTREEMDKYLVYRTARRGGAQVVKNATSTSTSTAANLGRGLVGYTSKSAKMSTSSMTSSTSR